MEANANNDFATTLAEALDKAAATDHGLTFFNGRGELANHTSYRDLRERALRTARRFLQLGLEKGDGVAIVAETRVEFAVLFFACQYAGLTPIPLTAIVSLGGRDNYVRQLSFLIENSGARAAFATDDFLEFLTAATEEIELAYVGSLPAFESDYKAEGDLPTITPDDLAYVQYTSGSTKVARGVLMTQRAIMCNLEAIVHDGLKLGPQDRFFSWLPFYHDMGLVGKLLTPIAGKVGVGYLCSRDFAQRPRLWLKLLHETKATVSFAPAFGYGLCARRLREGDGQKYDLSAWRIAGIGAEMIRTKTINAFTQAVAGSGFRPTSFLPCYGMAEVGLAISFSTQNEGVQVDHVDRNACMNSRQARALPKATADRPVQEFVECGKPLRGISIEIRDDQRNKLGDREIGTIWVQSNSVMSGYLKDPETTASTLVDGWLNTGDLGYVVDNRLVVTGRVKDSIIINGRNYWPQDLEYVAEQYPGVRSGDAMVFAVDSDCGERIVMLIQCRLRDDERREALRQTIRAKVRSEFGCDCAVELVAAHTLPRTSSGKPSRFRARRAYVAATADGGDLLSEVFKAQVAKW